eukprot:3937804-Rhodomonas_salina.1
MARADKQQRLAQRGKASIAVSDWYAIGASNHVEATGDMQLAGDCRRIAVHHTGVAPADGRAKIAKIAKICTPAAIPDPARGLDYIRSLLILLIRLRCSWYQQNA